MNKTEPSQIPALNRRPGGVGIRLKAPSEEYADSFFEAMAEFAAEGNPQVSASLDQSQFPGYVQRLHELSEGKNLPDGYIPSREFWIIDGDGYAGRIILGLSYTPGPTRLGNHVGYAVRPSKRRRMYATQALEQLISEARRLKFSTLMPVCEATNVASRKVIERNGGVLVESISQDGSLRFLIDLNG
jgi:predicted acetyltransferase